MFFSAAILAIGTAILLWIEPVYGALWMAITVLPIVGRATGYFRFIIKTTREVLELRKGYIIKPARGTHAPRPSILDAAMTENPSVQESVIIMERSESPVSMFDQLDGTDANDRDIQALSELPRRQTTGFEAHNANETSRRPMREDTESNVGIDLNNLHDVYLTESGAWAALAEILQAYRS